ncbi:hypothetical protein BP6252_11194 [Coleophoma cylindrospora]|uniref:Zn(2)-C6 fungal-type domain-containing protein n=1 Tax=Coleophoma cylindrospora TaxID=1849047 RepID=A0A3D8QPC3_9HELO|nr:hypothetical protein BP6252_11194 [Coleophoma cylindrospora]
MARSAKWGAACAPCVVAKTRCVRSNSLGAKCDRCQSLGKHCSDQVHGPRKKRHAKSSKTAQLEERLNGLIDSLKAPEEGECPSIPNSNQSHSSLSPSTISQAQGTASQEESVQSFPVSGVGSNVPATALCSCSALLNKEDLVPLESDDTLLSIYMNQLSNRFPFVIIPPGTTAVQLEATRPLLMKVIRMVASVRHLRSMRGQSRAVLQQISNAMLIRSERSLDLLQGILVFLGFYHYHCMTHAQFNNLNHLVVSLVGDMDLSTCPKSQERKNQRSRTNEERRALAGVWYMSSNVALVVKQLTPLSYTKYLDQCLKELEDAAEYDTDQFAVQLVRIQHLTNKIFHFHSRDQMVDELPGIPEVSPTVRLEAIQMELNRLRNALPLNLKSDYSLSCHYNSAYLRLFEPLLEDSHLRDAESPLLSSLSLSGLSILAIFSSFTAALKIWFEDWLTIPVCSYFYMSQPTSAQLIHAAMMLSRWVRVAGPSSVMISSAGTTAPRKEVSISRQTVPYFSGVPECPDLSLSQPPTSPSTSAVSVQILDSLRAKIPAQPHLQVDLFGIIDAIIIRFEAAKKEMAAAHGGAWENDTWDLAAEHMKMKKLKVEKWCEIVATVESRGRTRMADTSNSVGEGSGGTMNMLEGRNTDYFDWLIPSNDRENEHWESNLFDEIMSDVHMGVFFDTSGDWSTGIEDDMGLTDGSSIEEGAQN